MIQWSVIIPTLWIPKSFPLLLSELSEANNVCEIIIISNSTPPSDFIDLINEHSKLRIIQQEDNIYVNPAWNLGVSLAQSEHVALCNDDILFNADRLNTLSDKDLFNTVIGCSMECFSSEKYVTWSMQKGHFIGQGWGCLILLAKSQYPPIPHNLKIWCGDEWLALHFRSVKSIVLSVETLMSESSSVKPLHEIAQKDILHWVEMTTKLQKLQIQALHYQNGGSKSLWNILRNVIRHGVHRVFNSAAILLRQTKRMTK